MTKEDWIAAKRETFNMVDVSTVDGAAYVLGYLACIGYEMFADFGPNDHFEGEFKQFFMHGWNDGLGDLVSEGWQ